MEVKGECGMVESLTTEPRVTELLHRLAALAAEMSDINQELSRYMMTETMTVKSELITLAEAAEITGRTYRTLQNWVADGTLPKVSMERFPGGGRILVSRERVEFLRDNPPRTGRPPQNSA
jgi:excisionase family DNA binding protein